MDKLSSDAQVLLIPFCYAAVLFVLVLFRTFFLSRTNRRLTAQQEKMEKLVLNQHSDIIGMRRDSNAWRGVVQNQFDAFRAEASRRLEDTELRYAQVFKQQEARMAELQALLAQALPGGPKPVTAPVAFVPPAAMAAVVPNDVILPDMNDKLAP